MVHLFRKQAEAGLQLTVTDPLMTRFFITLDQAAQYVDQAIEVMTGGEVFVPILPAWTVGQVASLLSHDWQVIGPRPGGGRFVPGGAGGTGAAGGGGAVQIPAGGGNRGVTRIGLGRGLGLGVTSFGNAVFGGEGSRGEPDVVSG